MEYSPVFEAIDALKDEYLQLWIDICNLESPTSDKAGVDAVGAYLIAHARKRGWAVEVCPQAVSGDAVCITMNPDAAGAPVAISGHMDTVHPVGSFGVPAARIEGDLLHAPGAYDCKGGIAAGLLAMAALDRADFRERPVLLLLQSDEENSSRTSDKATVRFLCEKAKNAVAFLNVETAVEGRATVRRKGILRYRFTVTGTSIHASRCWLGASAVAEAAHKILALEQHKDPNGLTFSCGLIQGGTADNTVPETCVFSLDIRFPNDELEHEAERIVQEVASHATVEGTSCTVERISRRCAMEYTEKNRALFADMNRVFVSCGLAPLNEGASAGGSDAADVTAYGIPCLDSMGVTGEYCHTLREYGEIPSLASSAKQLAALAMYL